MTTGAARSSTRHLPAVPRLEGRVLEDLVRRALLEDLGGEHDPVYAGAWGAAEHASLCARDLGTSAAVPAERMAQAELVAKRPGIVAGLAAFAAAFRALDPSAETELLRRDGDRVESGERVARVAARARALLCAERTALNLVQRASGIATLTRRFVDAAGPKVQIVDTRKTAPGLRVLDKHAVVQGGGANHRFGLFDEVMLKDNHLDLSGAPSGDLAARTALVAGVRAAIGSKVRLHVEARNEDEARAAIEGGADVVLLDNFAPAQLAKLVPKLRATKRGTRVRRRPKVLLEASGGVDLDTVAKFAATGVDRISIGALTHSAPALDLSLRIEARA